MRDYAWMYEYCLNRFGSREALEARLPQPKSAAERARWVTTATCR